MTLLYVVGQLPQVELLHLGACPKPVLPEAELGESPCKSRLATFEASSNSSSCSGILTLVSSSGCLTKTAAGTSSNTFGFSAGTWVVPEIIRGEWQQSPILLLFSRQRVSCNRHTLNVLRVDAPEGHYLLLECLHIDLLFFIN